MGVNVANAKLKRPLPRPALVSDEPDLADPQLDRLAEELGSRSEVLEWMSRECVPGDGGVFSLADGTRTIVIRDELDAAAGTSCCRKGSGAAMEPRRWDRRRAGGLCEAMMCRRDYSGGDFEDTEIKAIIYVERLRAWYV